MTVGREILWDGTPSIFGVRQTGLSAYELIVPCPLGSIHPNVVFTIAIPIPDHRSVPLLTELSPEVTLVPYPITIDIEQPFPVSEEG
jgi:hypothetical protein